MKRLKRTGSNMTKKQMKRRHVLREIASETGGGRRMAKQRRKNASLDEGETPIYSACGEKLPVMWMDVDESFSGGK